MEAKFAPDGRGLTMIRIALFDLGLTLVDVQGRPFPHVQEALATIAGFRTAAGKPLRTALVSDFAKVDPPLTPARIKPVFDDYLARLAATGLRGFFEPVARRVTLSTHVGVPKPDRAVFEKALSRLRVKASLDECVLITEDARHVSTVRTKLGMQALRFGPSAGAGVDFDDWSQAPALLAHLLGTHRGANLHAAIKACLSARGAAATDVQAGSVPGEYRVSGTSWHAVSIPGQPALQGLQVALPMNALVRRGARGELHVELPVPDPAALSEASNFVGSLAAHGRIAGAGLRERTPTHAIETHAQGRPRLVRQRSSSA